MENLLEVAKNMEIEGEEYYKKLARETTVEELTGVFLFIADQEEDHFKLFEYMQEGKVPDYKEVKGAFSVAKDAFKKITPDFSLPGALTNAKSAYKTAVSMERKTVEYYTSLLEKIENNDQKEVLQMIIEEEEKHQALMESLCEFVERPNEWLENAEFNHLEEY